MICRMCLNESFNLIEIFGEEGHQMGISSVISDHFWFQPTIDDPVSTSICNDCWRNTESFHVFYLNVKTAQDLLAAAQPVAYIVKAEPEEPFEYPNTKSLVSGRQRSNCDNYQSTINVSGSDFTTDSNSGTSFAQKTQAASYANQSALSREGLLKTEPDDYGEVSYTDSQLISPNIALLNEEGMDVGSTALLPSNETDFVSGERIQSVDNRQPSNIKSTVRGIEEILLTASITNPVREYIKCVEGIIILNYYTTNNGLLSAHRNKLAHIIINKEMDNLNKLQLPYKIRKERFSQFAKEICEIFPNETPQIYFTPYDKVTKKLASGKLWDAYNNFKKREKLSRQSNSQNTQENLEDVENVSDLLMFLKMNSEPYDKILNYWKKTFKQRREYLQNTERDTSYKYFQDFPIFKGPYGHFLITADFDVLYSGKGNKLFENWSEFNRKVQILATKKGITEIREIVESKNEIGALVILPYLFPVAQKRRRDADGKQIEFTRQEIQKTMFLLVKDSNCIADIVQMDSECVKQNPETLTPKLIFVGESIDNIVSSYVLVNDTLYSLNSPLAALDTCFKCFFGLQLNYPLASQPIWQFIQTEVYEITTPCDKRCPALLELKNSFSGKCDNITSVLAAPDVDEVILAFSITESVRSYIKCVEGMIILNYYKEHNGLLNSHRNKLANLIINKEMENLNKLKLPYKIHKERFCQFAKEISEVFPTENPHIYFTPYDKMTKKLASGKLYEVYNRFKKREKSSRETVSHLENQQDDPKDSEDVSDLLAFLKTNSEPYEKILGYWKTTFKQRRELLKNKESYTTYDYFQDFPILKGPQGHSLIAVDFDILYPDNRNILFEKWSEFNKKVQILATKKGIPEVKEIVESNNEISALVILPYLLAATNKRRRTAEGKKIEFTKQEIEKSVFLLIKDANILHDTIQMEIESAKQNSAAFTPKLVFVGETLDNIVSSYVLVNDILYSVNSPLAALDTCFKCFFGLQLNYPSAAYLIWQFIQTEIYAITTPSDKRYTTLLELKTDLRSIRLQQNEKQDVDSRESVANILQSTDVELTPGGQNSDMKFSSNPSHSDLNQHQEICKNLLQKTTLIDNKKLQSCIEQGNFFNRDFLNHSMEMLHTKIDSLISDNKILMENQKSMLLELKNLRSSNIKTSQQHSPTDVLIVNIPCTRAEDFKILESNCMTEYQVEAYLKNLFHASKQEDFNNFVVENLSKLITDEAACSFSWFEQQNSTCVQEFFIIQTLKNVSLSKFVGATEESFNRITKIWFLLAKDRDKKRKIAQ